MLLLLLLLSLAFASPCELRSIENCLWDCSCSLCLSSTNVSSCHGFFNYTQCVQNNGIASHCPYLNLYITISFIGICVIFVCIIFFVYYRRNNKYAEFTIIEAFREQG